MILPNFHYYKFAAGCTVRYECAAQVTMPQSTNEQCSSSLAQYNDSQACSKNQTGTKAVYCGDEYTMQTFNFFARLMRPNA